MTYCKVGREFIFLDTLDDRYVALQGEERASFARLVSHSLQARDQEIVARLVGAGLLSRSLEDPPVRPCMMPAAASALGHVPMTAAPGSVLHACARLALAAAALRLRPLRHVLARLARRKARRRPGNLADEQALRPLAAAFATTALIAAPLDRCLPRALALAHAMIDLGLAPDLVIGVRLQPFGAHSWVEHAGVLVSDTLEHVREFTPILAI